MHAINFHGVQVHTFTWHDKPCWLAPQISMALGYKKKYQVSTCIRTSWERKFTEGEDYEMIRPDGIGLFKRVNGYRRFGDGPLKGVSLVTVLFEAGLLKVLSLSSSQVRVEELRHALIRPSPETASRPEDVAPLMENTHETLADDVPAYVALQELRTELERLGTVGADRLAALSLRIAELRTGMSIDDMFRHTGHADIPHDVGGSSDDWKTASELGKLWRVHRNVIGRMANDLGWREGGPGVKFKNENHTNGNENTRYFNQSAAAIIYRKLRDENKLPKPRP